MRVFNDVKNPRIEEAGIEIQGKELLKNISSLKIGTGDRAFKGDDSGIWLGANTFEDAPYRVSSVGVVRLKDEYGTTIIDAGGLVTDNVLGNDTLTKNFGVLTFSNTTPTFLTDTDLVLDVRNPAMVLVNVDMQAIKNDGAILWVLLKIDIYNHTTALYSAYTSSGTVLQFETAGIFPWRQSFSGLYFLNNTRGGGLPQQYKIYLEAYNSTGSSTLYQANISYIKLNG